MDQLELLARIASFEEVLVVEAKPSECDGDEADDLPCGVKVTADSVDGLIVDDVGLSSASDMPVFEVCEDGSVLPPPLVTTESSPSLHDSDDSSEAPSPVEFHAVLSPALLDISAQHLADAKRSPASTPTTAVRGTLSHLPGWGHGRSWYAAEDEALLEGVRMYGNKWDLIAGEVSKLGKHRTTAMVRARSADARQR